MTLTEMIDQATTEVNDSSDRAKTIIKAGINRALTRMRARLRREYTFVTKKFSWVEGQASYQAPEDIIRGGEIYAVIDGKRTALTRVDDDNKWDLLIEDSQTAERPLFYRWTQPDIFEVFPAPDANINDGGRVRYQSRAMPLSQDDVTAGTVDLTNGSATVTGTTTAFDVDMIGRFLKLADGNRHLSYYRIIDVASTTELTLENHWGGATVSGKNYKIGEQPNVPSEYHQSLIDKGIQRFYMSRKDSKLAKEYGEEFDVDALQAEGDYESNDTSTVIESVRAPKHTNIGMIHDKVEEIQ